MHRFSLLSLLFLLPSCTMASNPTTNSPFTELDNLDSRWQVSEVLDTENFDHGLGRWRWELQDGGKIAAEDGALVIDVPAGASVWFTPLLKGPVAIQYTATVIDRGGPNDRVSDLNCFWMARDSRSPQDLFATQRSGAFPDYHQLLCYYVGLGGNSNTTTRFRRYIGDPDIRPMLPEHDLSAPQTLITANRPQTITLVACDGLIQYYRNGVKLFELEDPEPFTSGWFALRTVHNHMRIENLKVYRLACTCE